MPPDSSLWFNEYLQPHEARLRAWLASRYGSDLDIDDLVQESFLRVLRVHGAGGVLTSPKALLFATARNLAIDRLRRRQVIPFASLEETDLSFVADEVPDAAEQAASRQELEMLTQAVQSLPDRCRKILTLRKIYGLSYREIGHQLGIGEHTVETQVKLGMRRCAAFLEQRGMG